MLAQVNAMLHASAAADLDFRRALGIYEKSYAPDNPERIAAHKAYLQFTKSLRN